MKPFKNLLIAIVLLCSVSSFSNLLSNEKIDPPHSIAVVVDDMPDFESRTFNYADHYHSKRFNFNQDRGSRFDVVGPKSGYCFDISTNNLIKLHTDYSKNRIGYFILEEDWQRNTSGMRVCRIKGGSEVVQGNHRVLSESGDGYRHPNYRSTAKSARISQTISLAWLPPECRTVTVWRPKNL